MPITRSYLEHCIIDSLVGPSASLFVCQSTDLQATLTLKSEICRSCFIHVYMVKIIKLKTEKLKRDTFSRLTQN